MYKMSFRHEKWDCPQSSRPAKCNRVYARRLQVGRRHALLRDRVCNGPVPRDLKFPNAAEPLHTQCSPAQPFFRCRENEGLVHVPNQGERPDLSIRVRQENAAQRCAMTGSSGPITEAAANFGKSAFFLCRVTSISPAVNYTTRLAQCGSLRIGNLEIATNLYRHAFLDFGMTRHCRDLPSCGVDVNGVPRALAQEGTAISLKMSKQLAALHRG